MEQAATLVAHLGNVPREDVVEVEAALAQVLQCCALAWPAVRVEPVRFVRYLAARLPPDEAVVAGLNALHTSDLYLACACSANDAGAIAALEAAFFHDRDAALARLSPGPSFADEAKQRARVKLFVGTPERPPRIVEFSGRGELRAFVGVVLMREGLSLRRGERLHAVGSEQEAAPTPFDKTDPELVYLRRTYAAEFERAFAEAVNALTSEERNLLRYHYVDRLNIDHIGAIYGVHRVSASRRLARVRAALVEGTRGKLAEQLRLEGSELHSVLRLIQSQVDISLRRALGEAQLGA